MWRLSPRGLLLYAYWPKNKLDSARWHHQRRRIDVQGAIKRVDWYWKRLRSMSPPEVLHRIEEQRRRWFSRYRRLDLTPYKAASLSLPIIPDFANDVRRLASAPGLVDFWRKTASAYAGGRFEALGKVWPFLTGDRKWHLDPGTGQHWPSDVYCFRIPYRHTSGFGDIKHVWELNRLQYLQTMAATALVLRDEALATRCAAEIENWIDANPPFDGVNWVSGIELALRVVSITVVTSLLAEDVFTPAQRDKLARTLAAHAYWLDRYPSRYSSANNHLVSEAGGLFLLGVLIPELPDAARYADYGFDTLCRETLLQIHPDGVGGEQSPTYEAFTLEWLLLCAAVGLRIGRPFPDKVWSRIEAAGEFLRWTTDAAGDHPRIGDDDEGSVFDHPVGCGGYVASMLGMLAQAVGRSDLTPPGIKPQLRHALFGLPPPPAPAPSGVRSFEDGGYTVLRGGVGDCRYLLVLDHGPLGYLATAAHGHADALAVWLHVGGRPILVDAGTYLYHSGRDWRDYFRGTAAHNTLTIRGQDQSRITGPFNWGRRAKARLLDRRKDGDRWRIEAEHDGYVERFGVRHRRALDSDGQGGFVIRDRLIGERGPVTVEIGFLFHPDLAVTKSRTGWVASHAGDPIIEMVHAGPLRAVVYRGSEEPRRGWYSPRFGVRQPSAQIVFSGDLTPEEEVVFRICLSKGS